MTWLNLLSVQPLRAHIVSFPRLAREAHGTHSLQRVLKDPGVGTGSVTLQIVRTKIIERSFAFAIRGGPALGLCAPARDLELEAQVLGFAAARAHSPPVHRKAAGHRHNDLLAPRSAGLGV